ncbi:hypothetical protein CYMTET_38804 [Cymbomonas tetramitiformis]|uniref:Reverse transcriptase domain-containing protein n=1 Tax=Cymbomonas tetramitiformis TaxID=36881 RepID=A0AAE0CBB5_9CHLO|nr:hypothetical protein CYMTET_38804 [Cymbomonas tetramitiformis]
MEGAAGQAADPAVTDCVNYERRVDGGRSAGQSVGPAMAAGATQVGSRRSGRQAERRQAAERRGRSAGRSGLPGRMTTRSTGTDRRGTRRWASLNVASAREAVGGSAREAVAPGAAPSAGGGGRGGSQQARRRRAQRSARAMAVEVVSGGSARDGVRAGRRPGRGAGAGGAQRRTRSVNDMAREGGVLETPGESGVAEAQGADGPDHSRGEAVSGRDPGGISVDLALAGDAQGAAVEALGVGTGADLDGGGLESPPVPEGWRGCSARRSGRWAACCLVGGLRGLGGAGYRLWLRGARAGGVRHALDPTPDGAPAVEEPAWADAGSAVGSDASGRGVEQSGGPHRVRSLPSEAGCAAGAMGETASSSRSTRSTTDRGRQRSRVADGDGEAGAAAADTARTNVGMTMRVTRSASRAAGRQQVRVPGDTEVAVRVPGGTSGAGGRAGGRLRHVIQWDDSVGNFEDIDLSNSRVPIEFLSGDGAQVLWRHVRAASRRRLADPGGPGRRAGDVPRAARTLAVEACDAPVVESEAVVEESGTPGGGFALLEASALEALLRGEAGGAGASFHSESVLSRDLSADEVDGISQHLHPPEVVRYHEGRWYLAMMLDGDSFVLGAGLVQGSMVTLTLRAAWDAMREARALLGGNVHGPLPAHNVVVEELAQAPSGLSASEAVTALTAFRVQGPEELGDECYICGQDWEPGQGGRSGNIPVRPLGVMSPAPVVVASRRAGRRRAAEYDGDPPPGEDEPAFRCPVCTARVHPNPVRMSRHLRQHHEPDDYALTDLSAFGCAACPRCEVAYASGAPLTSHHSTCTSVVEAGEDAGREAGPGVAGRAGGTPGASRGRRPGVKIPADPVIPDASWDWLRGMDLAEVFACPLTTARHVPKRARNHFAEAMRWVMRSLGSGDEDFWRLLGLAPRLLLGSIPEARKKSLPAEVVRERVRRFLASDWEELYRVSVPSAPAWPGRASEERAFADVVSLVKEGQLSKAVRRLDPGALAPLVEETLEALRDLHPAGDGLPGRVQAAPLELEEAAVEAECKSCLELEEAGASRLSRPPLLVGAEEAASRGRAAPLELEEAAVEAECRRLPVVSGPGCSQLRFEHIGVIFGGGDGLPAIKHACEQFVGDRVPAGVLPWIMGARLVALLKPGGGVRPIACGESLRRLASKVVCRQMRTRWATYFSAPPREGAASSAAQLGVGVPGGAEVCVHTVQALLGADPTWSDLALDCKNAFNTVKRGVIYKEVSDNFPELLGMAESSFRHQARLGWQGADGRFRWVESAEGAQQGDPLGPFFTAVALQPALQATLDEHPGVFIMAYLDDIHIIGPPDKARAAYGTIVPLLRAAGLELNVSKSTVYSPAGPCPEFADVVDGVGAPMPGSETPLGWVKVLGIPVGSDQWVADKCVEMAFAARAVLPKLARLDDPQVQLLQLLLLRFCAHPRFMHLVRGVPPHLLMRGALAHDIGIQECLQEVAGSPYPLGEEAVALSQLPTRWGGLGLSSAQRLAPAGWLGSWAQVWGRMVVLFPAVRDMLPHLGAPEGSEAGEHPLAAGMVAAMGDVCGARARVVEALGAGHPVPESLRVPEEAPVWGGFGSSQPTRQKELTNYQHGSDWLRLFDGANSSVRARLLSLSRDGATAHLNALPHEGGFRMRPTAAVIALCLQLGASIPLVREISAVGTGRCACGEVVDEFGYHYLACNRRGMFTYRHDAVQDVLYEMLCKVFDPASVKRTHVYHRSYSPHWRPDITVLNFDGRGRHLVIDVAVGFPCAQTHVDGAARVPLHTAAVLERQKAYTYGDISPHRLVAFAVEAFGGLGEQAKQLLRDCARRRQDRLGPEMASATWSTPTFESYWEQRIMVALQGAQAFGLHGRALEDYPQ